MNPPRHILIIRPSALGDVCRTVPVLVSLKRHWPEARVDWLVQRGFEGAILGHPDLHEAIPFDRRALSLRRVATGSWRSAMAELMSRLRTPRYDLVVDAQGLFRSGFFAAMTGSRTRVGYARAEEFGSIFYSRRIAVDRSAHAVDRMLALVEGLEVEPVPDMRLYSTPKGREGLPDTLRGARFATFAPTSRWPGKRWPQDRFLEVAKSLLAQGAVEKIAVVGGGNEREQCSLLVDHAGVEPRIVDLIGRTDVETLMAVIESSAIVLANDSAPLHMAVGFDRPLVGLFGPTKIG
ncbi:MAG: lipopolysaccharide heptosyltransferase family protein, partial [Phycisphaeraceae bacterium]